MFFDQIMGALLARSIRCAVNAETVPGLLLKRCKQFPRHIHIGLGRHSATSIGLGR